MGHRIVWVLIATLVGGWAHCASALDFSHVAMPDGLRVVVARGKIVSGDAERLRTALRSADRDPYGNKSLALDSPGGLVDGALAIVAVMDKEKVTTIVPPGAQCASACAQIIFVSGAHRVVLDGGRLGMHSCSTGAGAKDPLCNEKIAQNAVAHGVAHGSVMAFMQYAGPAEMIWFDGKDADCWGLTRWPGFNRGVKPGEIAPCVLKGFRDATKPR